VLPGDPAATHSEHDRSGLLGCDAAELSASNESTSNKKTVAEIHHLIWLERPIAPSLAPRSQALNQPFAVLVFGLEVTNRFAWRRQVGGFDFGVADRGHCFIFAAAQRVKALATGCRENSSAETRAYWQAEDRRPHSGSQPWKPQKQSFVEAAALEAPSP
jgi:hypothetical protein